MSDTAIETVCFGYQPTWLEPRLAGRPPSSRSVASDGMWDGPQVRLVASVLPALEATITWCAWMP